MRPPTIPWMGYNLFRATAVVITAWMAVVQFVALADDMKAYSASKDSTSSNTTTTTTASTPMETAVPISTSTVPEIDVNAPVPVVTLGSIAFSPSSSTLKQTSTASISRLPTSDPRVVIGRRVPGTAVVALRRAGGEEAEGSDVIEPSFYGSSAVPNQPGGVFFVLVSRVMIAGLLSLLLLAQLGLPEDILYKHAGWLGPQSTPFFLGCLQLLVAVQTLSLHAKQAVLLPSWLMLGVGSINLLLGSTLLYLGRRLPCDPPPPLYFARSQRILYWAPQPEFYAQLNPKHPSHPAHPDNPKNAYMNHQPDRRRLRLESDMDDIEKQVLPPSNALEIGLEESDDEDGERMERIKQKKEPQYRMRPSKKEADHTDVSKGGYPTFSGHGVGTPGRNVPAGYVEESGEGVRFVSEEAQRVQEHERQQRQQRQQRQYDQEEQHQQHQHSIVQSMGDQRRPERSRSDTPSKAQERKSRIAPLHITPRTTLRRPPSRVTTRASILSAIPKNPINTQPVATRPLKKKTNTIMTPIGEEPLSATTMKSDIRKSVHSVHAAASDFGPRFPLPPTRPAVDDPYRVLMAKDGSKARRESSVDSLAGAAPWALQSSEPFLPKRQDVPMSPVQVVSARLAQQPKSPKAIKDAPVLHVPAPPSAEPYPRVESGIKPTSRPLTMLRSSLAPNARSPTTAEARTERVARGVRFDLNSSDALSASTISAATPGIVSPTSKTGIKIPGINLTIFNPFSAPATPRPRQTSVDSVGTVDSDVSAARPESFASVSDISSEGADTLSPERPGMVARGSSGDIDPVGVRHSVDERAGLPRRKSRGMSSSSSSSGSRPRSMTILGGDYLDSGAEGKSARRRYSSIDSY